MSGRAGRRGIDDKGIVILMVDENMSPSAGKQIVKVSNYVYYFYIGSNFVSCYTN